MQLIILLSYICYFIKNKGKKKFNNIGGFGSISNIPSNLKNPKLWLVLMVLELKVEIANTLNKYDTIGIDLVAMSVNDLIVQGAKPLLFLDYISINKIDLKKLKSILKGIVKGCKISNVNWLVEKLQKCQVHMKKVNLI